MIISAVSFMWTVLGCITSDQNWGALTCNVFAKIHCVRKKVAPTTFVNNNFKSQPIVKIFHTQHQQHITEIILYFCSNNFLFYSTAKLTFLLTVQCLGKVAPTTFVNNYFNSLPILIIFLDARSHINLQIFIEIGALFFILEVRIKN